MGDGVFCWLQLKEPASEELRALLNEILGSADEDSEPHDRYFAYFMGSYALLPQKITQFLVANQIQAAWSHHGSRQLIPAVMLYPEQTSWGTIDGEIAVPATVTASEWEEAKRAQRFFEGLYK